MGFPDNWLNSWSFDFLTISIKSMTQFNKLPTTPVQQIEILKSKRKLLFHN